LKVFTHLGLFLPMSCVFIIVGWFGSADSGIGIPAVAVRMKSHTSCRAKQSSRLYWISLSFRKGSRLSSHRSLQMMAWRPDASASLHRKPRKEAISLRLLEYVGK